MIVIIFFYIFPKKMDLQIVNLNSFKNIINRKSKKNISSNRKCWFVHLERINQITSNLLTNNLIIRTRWIYNNCIWEFKYQLRKKQIIEKWKKRMYTKIMNYVSVLRKGEKTHLLSNDNLVHIIEYLIH